MEPFVEKMRTDLNRTCRLLDDGVFLSFTPGESRQLKSEGQTFLHRLETMETGFLTVGLIGGTGVGKSTLMNALAGKEIAAASDRRPHTDRVLIYKHETVQPQSMTSLDGIPWQIIAHTSEEIRGIILCDLPDFDSIIDAHRQQVLDFLEHLDVLVWVTSVEKYADSRFYEFLETVPKAKQNYCFVLNKADQCFDGQTAHHGYDALDGVVKSFHKHIQKKGIDKPLLFPLSAKEAFDNASIRPWNQFDHFSRQIFQQKDFKEITAIKAANLDVEIRQFLSSFQKERENLKIFEQILDTFIKDISERRSTWLNTGKEAASHWIDQNLKHTILRRQEDLSCLTGPGYGIGRLFESWSHRFHGSEREGSDFAGASLSKDIAALFRQRIEWLTERFLHQLVYHNLPKAFEEKVHRALVPEIFFDDLKDRFQQVFSVYLSAPVASSRLFVLTQRLSYAVLFILFLLAIGRDTAWRIVIQDPGWEAVFQLLLSMLHTLFTGKGLAALGSLALLNLFLGFRFFHRYRRWQKKAAQKILDALTRAAGSVWQETLEDITAHIERLKTEIKDRLKDLSGHGHNLGIRSLTEPTEGAEKNQKTL